MKFDRSMFTKKFVTESREHVEFLEKSIVSLEGNPEDLSSINEIKRSAHTLKGSARMLKYKAISGAAHYAEDLFISLIDKKVSVNQSFIDALLELAGFIHDGIESIASGGEEPALPDRFETIVKDVIDGSYSAAVDDKTTAVQDETDNSSSDVVTVAEEETPEAYGQEDNSSSAGSLIKKVAPSVVKSIEETVRIGVSELELLLNSIGEIRLNQRVVISKESELTEVCKKLLLSVTNDSASTVDSTILWQIKDLQRLLFDVEEMQHTLSSNIRQTYYEAEKLRMIPLQGLFERFILPVRESARSWGKRIKLVIEGGNVTIDKQIVDLLYGPLLHLVNNAIAHGIEDALAREKAGKNPTGIITISASPLAGSIEIVVSDDGSGIDCDRVVAKALSRKLITEESVQSMSREDKLQLVFAPGLSTAEIITELSGRGVGMDVVRMTIEEQLKGTIILTTESGVGTTTVVRLPLSLSSNRLFIIRVHKNLYAIPLSSVITSMMFDELDTIPLGSGKAVKFENQFIPLIPAGRFLFSDKTDWDIQSGGMIIIVASGSERVALLIDEIVDEQEMMIKPLPDLYEHLMYVGGITFGRDGTLIPLLHVPDLIEQSHMSYGKPSGAGVSAKTVEKQIQRILVVDDSYNTREVQKHILEAHGYSVLLAGDGAEALDKLDEEDDVSLVVTDIEMPVLDGFGLVKKIRVHKTYSEIPIVILSSRESVEDRSRGVEAGANAYIVKRDFDEEKLTATLRTLLP